MSGHGHGPMEGENKKIALLIAVLALFLAIAETMAKGAQTSALSYNVEASNLWAFFQAKTIRQTVVRTASEVADLERARNADPHRNARGRTGLQEIAERHRSRHKNSDEHAASNQKRERREQRGGSLHDEPAISCAGSAADRQ